MWNHKTIPPYLTNRKIHNTAFTNWWYSTDSLPRVTSVNQDQWKCWFSFDLTGTEYHHMGIRGNNMGGLLSWKHLRGPEIQNMSREREREISLVVYTGEAAKPQWSHEKTTWDTHTHTQITRWTLPGHTRTHFRKSKSRGRRAGVTKLRGVQLEWGKM